jgi:hypothetical protein
MRWVVQGAEGKRYEQHTAFLRVEPAYAPHWHYPYYPCPIGTASVLPGLRIPVAELSPDSGS